MKVLPDGSSASLVKRILLEHYVELCARQDEAWRCEAPERRKPIVRAPFVDREVSANRIFDQVADVAALAGSMDAVPAVKRILDDGSDLLSHGSRLFEKRSHVEKGTA